MLSLLFVACYRHLTSFLRLRQKSTSIDFEKSPKPYFLHNYQKKCYVIPQNMEIRIHQIEKKHGRSGRFPVHIGTVIFQKNDTSLIRFILLDSVVDSLKLLNINCPPSSFGYDHGIQIYSGYRGTGQSSRSRLCFPSPGRCRIRSQIFRF